MAVSRTWPAYGQQSDPSDFLNATVTQNDAFAEFYTPGSTDQFLTPVDLTQLDGSGLQHGRKTNRRLDERD